MVVHVKRRIEDNDRSIGTGFAAIILGSSPFFCVLVRYWLACNSTFVFCTISRWAWFLNQRRFSLRGYLYVIFEFISEELGRVNLKRIHFYFIFHEKILNTLLRMELRTKFWRREIQSKGKILYRIIKSVKGSIVFWGNIDDSYTRSCKRHVE